MGQTALAELALLTAELGRCRESPTEVREAIREFRRVLGKAFLGPALRRFIESGPPEATIGYVLIWLALAADRAEALLPRVRLERLIAERNVIALERTPMRTLELRYFLDRAQIRHEMPSPAVLFERSVLAHKLNPETLGPASTYAITHLVFYATDFGHAPAAVIDRKRRTQIGTLISVLLERMLAVQHWDLVAELVLACRCLGLANNDAVAEGWRGLERAQDPDGAVGAAELAGRLAEQGLSVPLLEDLVFQGSYHKALVTAMAGYLPSPGL